MDGIKIHKCTITNIIISSEAIDVALLFMKGQ
jgi:hypothetical protein